MLPQASTCCLPSEFPSRNETSAVNSIENSKSFGPSLPLGKAIDLLVLPLHQSFAMRLKIHPSLAVYCHGRIEIRQQLSDLLRSSLQLAEVLFHIKVGQEHSEEVEVLAQYIRGTSFFTVS